MECTIKWFGEARFDSSTGSGHVVHMEGGAGELGGRNQHARPMELILSGAGGCTAYDIVLLIQREPGVVLEGFELKLDATRAEVEPKVFTRIHYHYVLRGQGIKAEAVERAIAASATRLSSAAAMMGCTAELVHDFEIIPSA